ncbi:hypothetical protein F8M41_004987 [Gigaspora margarita]|uniref:Uncharacterized protein n=1 Tax=Gigaspora margarita TaxID=4874 RepID=A0A8H3X8T8_GIGMA|nr:hypothetical protein F8M41_004987 [Gigaspora margarita]
MNEFCNVDNYYNVIVKVINSTFNEYGEQYFVTMDNNFVKDLLVREPLKGIHDDEVVMGSVRLTIDASKTFLARSEDNKSE